jgi:tripartite-type tricarboxylate transporter receptor subunit TctC
MTLLPFLAVVAALAAASGSVPAQNYPAKPIRVIVPQPAGDACDVLTRLITQKMATRLGQQFIVDNRPGASGTIGLALLLQAPADGYTIACGQGGNMSVVPHAMKNVPYNVLKDFAGIAIVATNYLALVVHPSVPFNNVGDLVKYAKAHPGKLSFGSNGEGAFIHFTTELFRSFVGFEYLHVPFKGIGPMVQDMLGGGVDAAFGSFTSFYPYVKAGRLKILGVARATRAPNYPDIPAIAETVPGYSSGGWFGLVAPAKMSKEFIAVLNREANWAMRQPDVRDKMIALGLDVPNESPEYFDQVIRSDFEKYGNVARKIGLVPK